MISGKYFEEQRERVKNKLYSKQKHSAFGNASELANWYIEQLKKHDCKCYYCKTSIFDINKLIDAKKLKTRAVRGEGKRGPVLEIDKNDDSYVPKNCVLACYYCNNDKSYTSSKEDYLKYFGGNRKKYFESLLVKITEK